MSKSYYYMLSFNVQHPVIRTMLTKLQLFELSESVVDVQVKSKFFPTFDEAKHGAGMDFTKKLPLLFPEKVIKQGDAAAATMTVVNPSLMSKSAVMSAVLGQTEETIVDGEWDDNCVATVFFMEPLEADEDDEEDEVPAPETWLVKYELYFLNDGMEEMKNGEFAFSPYSMTESYDTAYH